MNESYTHQEAIVSTDWVREHLNNPSVVIVEINTDLEASYKQGHIPGAIGWSLHTDLEDQVRRDIPSVSKIEQLLGSSGIDNNTTIVLYGDGNNRSATWAFWLLKYYRHRDVRLMNGGRIKWVAESRPLSMDTPAPTPKEYRASIPDKTIRATKDYIASRLRRSATKLLDTRTLEEFSGQLAAAPGAQQGGVYRLGRIPGAIHIPWDDGAAENGAFKPAEELRRMYEEKGVRPENEVIAYCRLGVRASYSWFVLKYLLGYGSVRNYDGSWTEWGNAIGVPIETDASAQASAVSLVTHG